MFESLPSKFKPLAPWIALALLLTLAWLAYHPGLSGGFLFDDYVNLDALGNYGRIDNWRTFWRYITSGTADPTGRPLALLSFLLDANDWPADPAPFLRTNLLLHLLNGALLFRLLQRLGRQLAENPVRSDAVALLASGLWLLHPLFVSTTLYVVQREAMLPATFVLLGLLAYARGRERFDRTAGTDGLAWMAGGIIAGTGLAMLCKGNGALLPMLAWVLEANIFSRSPIVSTGGANQRLRACTIALLVVPSLLLLAYVAHFLASWNTPLGTRPWTIGQRVLTEPRVLFDYLRLLVVPRSVSTGLYNDDYVVSNGLMSPPATLIACTALIGLLASGILLRRRWPVYSTAVLFFLVGHLLESSTIPIELYFEHRNYLPAMLAFWPVAHAVVRWKRSLALRLALAVSLLTLLALTTYHRTLLWGNPELLASLWARQNQDSSRAQATWAIADLRAGRPQAALDRLAPLWRQRPYDLQIAFNAIDAACETRGLEEADKHALAVALAGAPNGQLLVYKWIGGAIEVAAQQRCPGLGLADVERWIDAALRNSAIDTAHVRGQDIEPLLGQLALRKGQPDEALRHFDLALAAFPTPDVAARQASLMASAGAYTQALAHLDTYERLKSRPRALGMGMPRLHAKVLEWQDYWPFEMARLRRNLVSAIAESNSQPYTSGVRHDAPPRN